MRIFPIDSGEIQSNLEEYLEFKRCKPVLFAIQEKTLAFCQQQSESCLNFSSFHITGSFYNEYFSLKSLE